MAKVTSKIDVIETELAKQGRIYTVPDDVVDKIDAHIRQEMEAYQHELYRKHRQSIADMWNVILT